MRHQYFIYIMTNDRHTVLYTGVTNDLLRRVGEHRAKLLRGFTARYNADKLVYLMRKSAMRVQRSHAKSRSRAVRGGGKSR